MHDQRALHIIVPYTKEAPACMQLKRRQKLGLGSRRCCLPFTSAHRLPCLLDLDLDLFYLQRYRTIISLYIFRKALQAPAIPFTVR
jgi:hypothetical protein